MTTPNQQAHNSHVARRVHVRQHGKNKSSEAGAGKLTSVTSSWYAVWVAACVFFTYSQI